MFLLNFKPSVTARRGTRYDIITKNCNIMDNLKFITAQKANIAHAQVYYF